MGYSGQIATIPLGVSGIQTDDPSTITRATKLSVAKNVTLLNGRVEKDFGSARWNDNALTAGIANFLEYRPDVHTQRVFAVTKDGRVHRFRNKTISTVVDGTGGAPAFLLVNAFVTLASVGAELTANPRKLLIFTGNDPIQVVVGDGTTRRDLDKPAADWTGRNQPVKGILHRNRLVVFQGHTIYLSEATDHEDFTTTPLTFPIAPGEGDGISDIFVFKGRLFILKSPFGLYFLNDADNNTANWTVQELNNDFGGASPSSAINVLDDMLISNNYGSITSLNAVQAFGDVESADLFNRLRIDELLDSLLSQTGGVERHTLYYAKRKLAYITYRSLGGNQNDTILQISFKSGRAPEVTIIDKDQPNCLNSISDVLRVQRPFYGAEDGYIYDMLAQDRNVNAAGYRGEISTIDLDFAETDPLRAELEKEFEFVEVIFQPTGNIDLTVEWFIDGRFMDSVTEKLQGLAALDKFKLDTDRVGKPTEVSARIPISGSGRRLKVRCYNSAVDENFKLNRLNIYYRLLSDQQDNRDGTIS